jgi:GGDEF domain-containing protein
MRVEMAVVERIRIAVSKTVNLGNYNSVKVEVSVDVGRNKDTDTPAAMRDEALNQAADALEEAHKEFVPGRRSGSSSQED